MNTKRGIPNFGFATKSIHQKLQTISVTYLGLKLDLKFA